MTLPRGATGFWDAGDGPPARVDAAAFRAAVHEAARQVGGRVERFEPPGITPNFDLMVIAVGQELTGVVCHPLLPWLALTRPPGDAGRPLTFRDDPALVSALERTAPFRVLDTATLATPVGRLDLSTLDRSERDQVAFWAPATLGELVFNWWD
ncbi:hypothetical protein AB0J74_03165 [Asanoa sp. NPDC049573]|uniref:hypothetical protein n=1 Tax=Asanoa sp. NPDC049573 TaxID=3155396 RepID=UPI003412289E